MTRTVTPPADPTVDLNRQQLLTGSPTPDGLQVELPTASFLALHVAVGGTGQTDFVTAEFCNRTAGALDYTIGWGGQANKDLIVGTLAAKSGVVLVLDRRPLNGGQTVWGKASGAGINAHIQIGRVGK